MTLGHISGHAADSKFYWLSNALFRFLLAVIVPEVMRVFRSNVRFWQNFRFFEVLAREAPFLVEAKIDPHISLSSCHALLNAVYRLSLRRVVFEIRGGGASKPPSAQNRTFQSPPGIGFNLNMNLNR